MLPDMMRAAGYYPSEGDISVMNSHLSFIAASRDMNAIKNIEFEDVLCLYANHRPLLEATHEDIVQAFLALGANPNNGKLPRDQLITLLQQVGEPMSMEELSSTLDSLTGMKKAVKSLPHTEDATSFASDILGFERELASGF
jgi:Ca2+-binding EF-hand superfamily protein